MNARTLSLAALILLAGFGLAACGDDDVDEVEIEDGEVEADD